MPITDKLRKVAGLFVIMDEQEQAANPAAREPMAPVTSPTSSSTATSPTMAELDQKLAALEQKSKSIDDIVRESHGPNLDEIKVSSEETSGALLPDGAVDFTAIYAAAKLPNVAFSAEQTLELLSKLPKDLSLDLKRQMVQATMMTMGATVGASAETIVADASRKLAALAAYSTDLQRVTAGRVEYAQSEIAALEARIAEQKQIIATAQQQVALAQAQCEKEADHLDDILEFFSLDAGSSKYA